jgi:putative alpha-1,2-mannosidase
VYVFGSPVVNDAVIGLPGNKTFHIKAINNTAANKYIQRVRFNGAIFAKTYLLHSDMMKGGELIFEMGSRPSATWGIDAAARPFSEQP